MTEATNPLNFDVLRVSHRGGKQGTVAECAEVPNLEYVIVSCSGSSAYGFPHEIALLSLKEETDRVYFADYSNAGKARSGTAVVVSRGMVSIGDERSAMASPP
jgi:beta-lactamase superfamily II metal-dependent hydrolase